MAIDTCYAGIAGLIDDTAVDRVIRLMGALGFELCNADIHNILQNHPQRLLGGLEEFRQHLGGNLCITLLTGIGSATEVNRIDNNLMQQAFDRLTTYNQ